MNDQTLAVLIGAATVAALRIIDFFFPKGRWYNWGGNSKEEDDRVAAADAKEDAKTDVKRREVDKSRTAKRKTRDTKRHDEEEEDD